MSRVVGHIVWCMSGALRNMFMQGMTDGSLLYIYWSIYIF